VDIDSTLKSATALQTINYAKEVLESRIEKKNQNHNNTKKRGLPIDTYT